MIETNKHPSSVAEFVATRNGLVQVIGSKLDNAQYIAMLFGEGEGSKSMSAEIGSFKTPDGRRFRATICGLRPVITSHEGVSISDSNTMGRMLSEGRENELFFETLAHLEVEGDLTSGGRYSGVFYSLSDAGKFLSEKHSKGEL
jgi:hypothetical protein